MNNIPSPPIWIKEKGKDILYTDYRLLPQTQVIRQFKDAIAMGNEKGGDLLVLSNFENVPLTNSIVEEMKLLGAEVTKNKELKSALLGITGIKRFLLMVYRQFNKDQPLAFSTHQEAIDYLVED
tara:strand:- start:963 stop:1334 length:372 start_codon:yes stop_codon:yes gene_type:complete